MDTLLSNGDFATDGRGYPIPCSGAQELLQRALIRLTIQQGCFDYDPTLGSRLYTLKHTSRDLESQALELVREALVPLPGLIPVGVAARPENGGENLHLTVLITTEGRRAQLEVSV